MLRYVMDILSFDIRGLDVKQLSFRKKNFPNEKNKHEKVKRPQGYRVFCTYISFPMNIFRKYVQ